MTFEIYEVPQGKVFIGHSDKNLSVGYLELNPKQELEKHNRPVTERLMQITGSCVMKLYTGDEVKEITLNEGDTLEIPPKQYHVHANVSDKKSITFWKAEGDITEIIQKIREQKEV